MLTAVLAVAALAATQPATPQAELVGFAVLPADTFRAGPTSGQFIEPANGRTPPFVDKQPVQGISSMVATDTPGTYFALSDNGFGAKANSADYVLCVYRVTPDFEKQTVAWDVAFELNDADHVLQWPILADAETYPDSDIAVPAAIKDKRLLTGGDFDPESMVRLPDGTFWLGDEYGPFLLHFDATGKLLESPVDLPGEGMHSPDHPTKDPATAKIGRSAGFEGMMLVTTSLPPANEATEWVSLFPVLEKHIADEHGLRIYNYIAAAPEHMMPLGWRRTTDGYLYELLEINILGVGLGAADADLPDTFLFIESDDDEAAAAKWKVLSRGPITPLRKEPNVYTTWPLADLLNLPDPNDLDGDGSKTFRFPFVTIESVVPVDDRTVLICNDNNYPFTNGRSETEPDHTEFILVRFDKPIAELGRE